MILATYNEKEYVVDMIGSLYKEIAAPLEVVVVDDNSPDGTADLVAGLDHPGLKLLRRKTRGLAGAFHRGILEARGDILCWMDADMCMPATVLKQMIDGLDDHHMVIGSRYAEGGFDNRHPLRIVASRVINWFARTVLGGHVKDYDSGFVAIRREVFDHVSLIPYGYGEYFIEFVYDSYRKGLKIKEVGYAFKDRSKGISKSAPSLWRFFVTGLHYIFRIISLRFRFLRGGTQ
ncbi:MAG: glycosyltransferase [Proteobacteria bacterium]|nr:glycosyltransferase [Pseudomonadota bacterium]MBU1738389.1 glycosyltransferase [Pseudomonadota bacterium]